jgi:hypothetical protein
MTNKRRLMYCALAMVLLLSCIGIYSKCQRKPVIESVERDTVVVYDTVPHYYPKPVEVEKVRTEYRFLTRVQPVGKTDTLLQHDSVLVEVPITSKHYGCKDYDAWVSGYEPSLDSIKVYQKTEVVTITKIIKNQKHFFLDVGAGCEYIPDTKTAVPFTELGLSFKKGKFGIGAYGGYSHDFNENKGLPYAKAKITYDIISF